MKNIGAFYQPPSHFIKSPSMHPQCHGTPNSATVLVTTFKEFATTNIGAFWGPKSWICFSDEKTPPQDDKPMRVGKLKSPSKVFQKITCLGSPKRMILRRVQTKTQKLLGNLKKTAKTHVFFVDIFPPTDLPENVTSIHLVQKGLLQGSFLSMISLQHDMEVMKPGPKVIGSLYQYILYVHKQKHILCISCI